MGCTMKWQASCDFTVSKSEISTVEIEHLWLLLPPLANLQPQDT